MGQKCRRVILDRAIDGRNDQVRCEKREEICDICEQGQRPLQGRRPPIQVRSSPQSQKRGYQHVEGEKTGSGQQRVHTIICREDDVRRSKKLRAGKRVLEIATVATRETRLPPPPPQQHRTIEQHQLEDENYFETFVRSVNHERRE